MYYEFTTLKKPAVYEPDEFEKLCLKAGASTIFNTILDAMTNERHSISRTSENRKRTVAIIYKLCFGLSQVCNWMQTDHGLYLKMCNLNQEGIQTQHVMGGSCSKTTTNERMISLSEGNAKIIDEIVAEAIRNSWQLVVIVDDYTSVHSIRRPNSPILSNPKYMCTIVIKVFKNVKAIPAGPANSYHDVHALDITSCVKTVSGLSTMHQLAYTYSSTMPPWIKDSFFSSEFERHRVTAHEYCDHESVQSMRQMDDVYLVSFSPLPLKSKNNFEAAFDAILKTKLADYFNMFLTPQPGDWPAQFYSRQIVYESLVKFFQPTPSLTQEATAGVHHFDHSYSSVMHHESSNHTDVPTIHENHSYSTASSSEPERKRETINNNNQPRILSVIPCIGPLHISLNARETLFNDFRPFFEAIHTNLFP